MSSTGPASNRPSPTFSSDELAHRAGQRLGLSREQIVIHPSRIISWGVDGPDGLAAS
jgi:hypothetical protein